MNELWRLVSLRLNFFSPTKKPGGFTETANGRRRRTYDRPETPWQRVKGSCVDVDVAEVDKRIAGINPVDLTREITQLAAKKTRALSESRKLDMTS